MGPGTSETAIEITPSGHEYVVSYRGAVMARSHELAKAYQGALDLCARLFDHGVQARVLQRAPTPW
ncbi:MAG TPA: hypothetical protein VN157_09760 [Caulobacter sp.]|nr:hypothetical protein [Caulobacter sp.]